MRNEPDEFQVSWDGGKEPGFTSRAQASRFVQKICWKVAPKKNYNVLGVIR